MSGRWIIYGSYGYTGELIARKAKSLGLNPILSGRNEKKTKALANELGLESRSFPLRSPEEIALNLEDCSLVLHCAGPFIETAEPMAKACILAGAHYLDITGEIPVFETLHSLSKEASKKSVMLLPGVGFDIVPTDCLAKMLSEKLPKADRLELAFSGLGEISPGTMKSALAQMPSGSKIRAGGNIVSIPFLSQSRMIAVQGKVQKYFSIPWGDVFTAFISTGIKNITVYTQAPEMAGKFLPFLSPAIQLLSRPLFLKPVQGLVGLFVHGPDESSRNSHKTLVWGEVSKNTGESVTMELETLEGYEFTVESALLITQKVLTGKFKAGFQTPSLAFGSELVKEIRDTRLETITS